MRTVRVVYDHRDEGGWTAESPDVPGFLAYDDDFEEVRRLAHEGLRLHFVGEPVLVYDPTVYFENAGGIFHGNRPVAPAPYSPTPEPETTAA